MKLPLTLAPVNGVAPALRSARLMTGPRAKRPRFTPNADDLRLLTEHLAYEVWMTFDLALTLATVRVNNLLVQDALVEVLPIHVRQLNDFFWKVRRSDSKSSRDAFAADYFDPGEWVSPRPSRPAEIDAVWKKVGWGVVHLTYGRAHVTPEQKQWEPVTIGHALAPVVLCFVDNVDQAKLDAAEFTKMRPSIEGFLAAFPLS